MFYSQYQQDEYFENHVFKGFKKGIFMDIGAHDGVSLNNTLFFENTHNWTGYNIEPIQSVYEKLIVNRPNSVNINCAISDTDGFSDFYCNTGSSEMLSGLTTTFDPRHLDRLKNDVRINGTNMDVIQIETKRVDTLCKQYNIDHIHYLSVDVEGAEMNVIKSIDFNNVFIDVIDFENNYEDVSVPIVEYLESKGYVVLQKHSDIFMIHKNSIFYPVS